MERFFEKYLVAWKNKSNRKPLIVRGARQVGKTYTIAQFAKNNFPYFINVNLERYPELKEIFKSKNPKLILAELSAYFSIPTKAGETLLFIDEIQNSPEAIVSLRYFHEEMPNFFVIAAGSLLDHTLNEMKYSMPVGRVEFGYLYPMTFSEFLIAMSKKGLYEYIKNYKFSQAFSTALHSKIMEYLRLYFFIGGMPEAVKMFAKTSDLTDVEQVHESILTSLQYDFAKYGTRKQQQLMQDCLLFTARNTSRKVKYTKINPNVDSKSVKSALFKLETSRIIHLIRKTKSTSVPINQMVDNNTFKSLFLDIGLANHLGKIKLLEIKNLITDYEGVLAEQFVGQELLASTFPAFVDSQLYYWQRESKNSNAEIDYLLQMGNNVYPVEVKAGKTGTLKSLQVFLAETHKTNAIRFNADLPTVGKNLTATAQIKKQNKTITYNLVSLPLYFSEFIQNFSIQDL